MEAVFIYALNCPITGRTRYLGKANDPYDRYERHLDENKREDTHKARWIRSLGENPILEVLDEVPVAEWQFWEREWIKLFRILLFDLTNATEGGDGGKNPSPETRAKLREKMLGEKNPMFGKNMSQESREKMRIAQTGRKRSPESIAKRATKLIGWKQPLAARAKVSAAQKGVKESPATCAAISARQIGRKQSLETIAKRVAKNTGRKRTPEQRERMSEAAFRRSNPDYKPPFPIDEKAK